MQHGNKVRQQGTSQVWMDDELATSLEREEGERLVRHAYLRAGRVVVRKRLHHASSCERRGEEPIRLSQTQLMNEKMMNLEQIEEEPS